LKQPDLEDIPRRDTLKMAERVKQEIQIELRSLRQA